MTFGEHLEELRQCLFRAIWGLAIGVVIGLIFGNRVVAFIQRPLEKALTNYYVSESNREVTNKIRQLNEQGIELPFTPEAAAKFVVDRQVLAEEFLISPRELVTQFELSLAEMRRRLDAERNKLSAALDVLQDAPGGLEPKRVKPSQIATIAEALQVVQRHLVQDSSGENSQRLSELVKLGEKLTNGAAISGQEKKQFEARFEELLKQLSSAAQAVQSTEAALSGLVSAVRQTPGFLEQSELMHIFLWRPAKEDPRVRAKSLSAHEAFSIYMKASFLLGAIIASPWVFFQIWSFVAAGLYRHERRFVYIFLPFSLALFLAGAALAFLYVFEPVLSFLFQFNQWMGIQLEPRISEWLSFVLILPLGFGIGFQLPLVMLFLERIGVFTLEDYLSQWRIAVVVIFVISAILTPPDPSSQLLMAIPLTLLYFGGMALCKFFPRKMAT
ncbi:MAG: twin-arginine translocase subunit TatC [Thermogutta sp.]